MLYIIIHVHIFIDMNKTHCTTTITDNHRSYHAKRPSLENTEAIHYESPEGLWTGQDFVGRGDQG